MEIIPFRIKASEEEDNFNSVYSFLIKGSDKTPYETEIEIDQFNDTGLQDSRCTCPHYIYRQTECKHIKGCLEILKQFDVKTANIKIAKSGGKDERR